MPCGPIDGSPRVGYTCEVFVVNSFGMGNLNKAERLEGSSVEPSVESAIRALAPLARDRFGVGLGDAALGTLGQFASELLRWNEKVNLTSITDPGEVAELHVFDSLAIAPFVPEQSSVLDVGTGGGFPGVPLAIARPDLQVTMVDRTERKILFLKTTLARLRVGNARARQVRIEGAPTAEGIDEADVAVSRAFTAPEAWLDLARAYVRPRGRILAMLGSEQPDAAELDRLMRPGESIALHPYTLPSGARRALLVLDRGVEPGR